MTACSKTCAGKLKAGEFHRKSDLQKKIISLLVEAGRYMTKDEILQALSVSSKTLSAYNVSTLECNRIAGHRKPSRIFENKVLQALESRFEVVPEATFSECVSPKGYPLRFDFYVPSERLLIEADGTQHRQGHPWHRDYHTECDKAKEAFAASSGMRLIRIRYTKRVTPEYVFSFLETLPTTT